MEERIVTEQMICDFEQRLKYEEKSINTIQKYLRDVRQFAAFVGETPVSKELVVAYKQALMDKGYAIRSINSMVASVNSLLEFLGWTDCKTKFFKVQRQSFCSAERELSKEEYVRLVKAARKKGNERLALLLQTICGTGIRVSELQFITVEGVKAGVVTVSLKGKSRRVFIVRELQKKLLQYTREKGNEKGAVFVTRSGKPMSRSNIWREMKMLCEEAGVDHRKVFPHNLRHLFARCFYGIEKDIAKLADILGHSSINTTWIYIATTEAEHRKQMERLRLIV